MEKVAVRIAQKQENQRMKQLYNNLTLKSNPRIGLPAGDCITYVDVENIIRCQGENNYTNIRFGNDKNLMVSKILVEFEELLEEFGFVRIHKTHLVNLKHIFAFIKSACMIKLSNNELLPVSRRRKESVLKRLKMSSRNKVSRI